MKNEWHHSLGGEEKIRANLSSRDSKGMSKTKSYDYGKVSVHAFGLVWCGRHSQNLAESVESELLKTVISVQQRECGIFCV